MSEALNIKKLEADLWESADLLRAGSKLTSNQYCMPVLGLLFLRYAYSRFKKVEAEILKDRPMRHGRVMPVEASDFAEKSALFLPKEAQYDYLVNLPEDITAMGLLNRQGEVMGSLGEVVNNAMELVEEQSEQLSGVLPKEYTMFSDELLGELLRIFNNNALDDVGGDVIGRIYEYFLNKFAKNIASDDGVFFTPKSLVKMIVNILEPTSGILLDPACGSGGMFVQTGDFVNHAGMVANNTMTFYGQEKVVQTGHVDVMISVGNNFFYTKSLPCTLWFFDKGKAEALRDKVLFIDARNYYTVADRTLNEWSEWQLRNMNAIVWLYRGEQEAYQSLLGEYHAAITEGLSGIRRIEHHFMQKLSGEHTETIRQAAQAVQAEAETPMEKLNQLEQQLTGLKSTISETVQSVIAYYASMSKSNYKVLQQQFKQKHGFALEGLPAVKKMLNAAVEAATAEVDELLTVLREARWLYEKFGEGEYQDVPGLCKIASRREIEGKGYSLTPGAYVGVAAQEDDGVDFGKRMKEIHAELLNLQEESNRLMETISKNMEEMGL